MHQETKYQYLVNFDIHSVLDLIPSKKQLESVVDNLENDQITTKGDIIKMKFIITHQEDRIEQLQKSAAHITDLLQDMNVYSN